MWILAGHPSFALEGLRVATASQRTATRQARIFTMGKVMYVRFLTEEELRGGPPFVVASVQGQLRKEQRPEPPRPHAPEGDNRAEASETDDD